MYRPTYTEYLNADALEHLDPELGDFIEEENGEPHGSPYDYITVTRNIGSSARRVIAAFDRVTGFLEYEEIFDLLEGRAYRAGMVHYSGWFDTDRSGESSELMAELVG